MTVPYVYEPRVSRHLLLMDLFYSYTRHLTHKKCTTLSLSAVHSWVICGVFLTEMYASLLDLRTVQSCGVKGWGLLSDSAKKIIALLRHFNRFFRYLGCCKRFRMLVLGQRWIWLRTSQALAFDCVRTPEFESEPDGPGCVDASFKFKQPYESF